jgi:type III pantothenate kinase
MQVGVEKGFLFEIEGMLAAYKKQFGDLTVVLTGGDAEYLSKRLKNSIFAQPNFLAEGLHAILIYNTDQ